MLPLNDNVLFRRDDSKRKSESGLIIEERVPPDSMFGFVIAAGPEASVKVGDRCLIGKNKSQQTLRYDGEDVVAVKDEDILAVCEEL